jgi:hypothetical protein
MRGWGLGLGVRVRVRVRVRARVRRAFELGKARLTSSRRPRA